MENQIPGVCETMDVNSTDVPLVDCINFSQMSNEIEFLFIDPVDGTMKRVQFACLVQSIEAGGNRGVYKNFGDASDNGVTPGQEWLIAKDNDLGMPEGLIIVQPEGY